MQVFHCPACGTAVFFHNTACTCGQPVTFDPDSQTMRSDLPFCANREDIGCNWKAEKGKLCRSCAMTETVPDLRKPENMPLWEWSEHAKRWVLANLLRWGWFTPADKGARPVFRMLSEQTASGSADVVMGHANGLITINVTEASDAVLAQRQEQFGELYRTMIGHIRHEVAHFLFLRLSDDTAFLKAFRESFGDERASYPDALKAHYQNPKPPGNTHITAYATAHPHEDWAETIAHLMHLTDLLDSSASTGLALPKGPPQGYDAYAETRTDRLLTLAIAITIAMNHVNRALDLPDLYPFVLTPAVRQKLAVAHKAVRLKG